MIKHFINLLPSVGGAGGAAIAVEHAQFTVDNILAYIIFTTLGAFIGYFVKLLLDKLISKTKK